MLPWYQPSYIDKNVKELLATIVSYYIKTGTRRINL